VATLVACGFVAGGLLVFTVLLRHVEGRGAPGVLLGAGATMAAAALAVVVAPTWAIVVVGLFHSAALDSQWLTLQTAALRVAPGREGRAMALIQAIEMAGIAIPIAFGTVADHFGIEWGMVCFAALPLTLVVPAIGVHRARLSGATP